ncbi:MAG: hypothetical protein NTW38_05915 [Candidatus Aminicenantes bacterium]|nr:hypothetical protein [Candidatus Aminicenantes bacterium]
MKKKMFCDWIVVAALVLLVDWILGIFSSFGLAKLIFLIFNIPFGVFYVWMESSWVGDYSYMLGLKIGEFGGLLVFLFVVLAQSLVYLAIYEWIKRKRVNFSPPNRLMG